MASSEKLYILLKIYRQRKYELKIPKEDRLENGRINANKKIGNFP